MPTGGIKVVPYVFLTSALFVVGCGSQNAAVPPTRIVCQEGTTAAEVLQATEEVLTRMHFPIEKLDVEQGLIRTGPLRGAQFFEFWRSDNASPFGGQEANLQSVRRSVEVRVMKEAIDRRPEAEGAYSLPPTASRLCLACNVSVQRLSLPQNEVAGVSEAYRIHSSSAPTLQRIDVSPQQRRAMAWIDLGPDPNLAARILHRVEQRLQRVN